MNGRDKIKIIGFLKKIGAITTPNEIIERYYRQFKRKKIEKEGAIAKMKELLEPLLIFHHFGRYDFVHEEGFVAHVTDWGEPGIATTLYALDALRRLDLNGRKELNDFIESNQTNILTIVFRLFREEDHGFANAFHAPATLYASYLALNIINMLLNPKCESYFIPLGERNARQFLGDARAQKIVNFTIRSQCPKTYGFFEAPNIGKIPTVQRTNAACLVLRHFGKEISTGETAALNNSSDQNLVFETLNEDSVFAWEVPYKERVLDFLINKCLKKDQYGTGFASRIGGVASTCSTWFALSLLQRLGYEEWIEGNKRDIISFLRSCCVERDNVAGFSENPGQEPDLARTCLVLSCLEDIFKTGVSELGLNLTAEKIINFTRAHRVNTGFAFKRGFASNLYATRNALKIANLLYPDLLPQEVFGGPSIAKFLLDHFFDRDKTLFSGYEISRSRRKKVIKKILNSFLLTRNRFISKTLRPLPYFISGIIVLPLLILSFLIYGNTKSLIPLYVGLNLSGIEIIALVGIFEWFVRNKFKSNERSN